MASSLGPPKGRSAYVPVLVRLIVAGNDFAGTNGTLHLDWLKKNFVSAGPAVPLPESLKAVNERILLPSIDKICSFNAYVAALSATRRNRTDPTFPLQGAPLTRKSSRGC